MVRTRGGIGSVLVAVSVLAHCLPARAASPLLASWEGPAGMLCTLAQVSWPQVFVGLEGEGGAKLLVLDASRWEEGFDPQSVALPAPGHGYDEVSRSGARRHEGAPAAQLILIETPVAGPLRVSSPRAAFLRLADLCTHKWTRSTRRNAGRPFTP